MAGSFTLLKNPLIRLLSLDAWTVFGDGFNREEGVGEAMFFFLRFSTDAIVLLTNWVREGVYRYAVGTNICRDWSCFYPWKSFSSWSWKVQHSTALIHTQSTQENFRRAWLGQMLKLSFQITWFTIPKGEGQQILAISWQLVVGMGGLGNCLVYDFR